MLLQKNQRGIRSGISLPVTGTSANISTAQSYFGGSSFVNNSSGTGYALVPSAQTSTFAFGTGNWTVEYFVRVNAISGIQIVFGTRPTGSQANNPCFLQYSNVHQLYLNGSTVLSTSISATTWTHIAFVRNGSSWTLYKNGTSASTYTNSSSLGASKAIFFTDDYQPGTSPLNGYVDELRISNIARYTGNFTPPTQPFIDDANTLILMHGDGPNGSLVFVDDNT